MIRKLLALSLTTTLILSGCGQGTVSTPAGNGNANIQTAAGASNPFRLDIAQAATADQDHDYGPEQMAFDNGKMDLFPLSVGTPNRTTLSQSTGARACTS